MSRRVHCRIRSVYSRMYARHPRRFDSGVCRWIPRRIHSRFVTRLPCRQLRGHIRRCLRRRVCEGIVQKVHDGASRSAVVLDRDITAAIAILQTKRVVHCHRVHTLRTVILQPQFHVRIGRVIECVIAHIAGIGTASKLLQICDAVRSVRRIKHLHFARTLLHELYAELVAFVAPFCRRARGARITAADFSREMHQFNAVNDAIVGRIKRRVCVRRGAETRLARGHHSVRIGARRSGGNERRFIGRHCRRIHRRRGRGR